MQVIPHITNEIIDSVFMVGKSNTDVVITEIGGTVGDIESLPFLEAIRQVAIRVGRENCMFIHVTLVPYLNTTGEQKSKPTQHSVKDLLSLGIQPDIIICRTSMELPQEFRTSLLCFAMFRLRVLYRTWTGKPVRSSAYAGEGRACRAGV